MEEGPRRRAEGTTLEQRSSSSLSSSGDLVREGLASQLATPAVFGVVMGVTAKVGTAWFSTVAGLVLLLISGPTLVSSTFTLWNWTMFLLQIADRLVRRNAAPRLLPFLLVNSWAIFTSFNILVFVDRNVYRDLAARCSYSMPKFHWMNTLGHFIPAVAATLWFALDHHHQVCDWTNVANVRVASLLFHVLWALRVQGDLRLNDVYIKRPASLWGVAWLTAAVTHIAVGHLVADVCHDRNN